MRPFNMAALRAGLPRGTRLLGLDPGARAIGIAISDPSLRLASPYGVLRRAKLADNAAFLGGIAAKEGAGGLVVGLPLSMDGSFGPAAQAAKDWGMAIAEAMGMPMALWDERLSTAAVERAMIEADLSRAKRARRIDGAAAAWFLQNALDATLDATREGMIGVVPDAAEPT